MDRTKASVCTRWCSLPSALASSLFHWWDQTHWSVSEMSSHVHTDRWRTTLGHLCRNRGNKCYKWTSLLQKCYPNRISDDAVHLDSHVDLGEGFALAAKWVPPSLFKEPVWSWAINPRTWAKYCHSTKCLWSCHTSFLFPNTYLEKVKMA